MSDDETKIVTTDELLEMERVCEESDGFYPWIVLKKLEMTQEQYDRLLKHAEEIRKGETWRAWQERFKNQKSYTVEEFLEYLKKRRETIHQGTTTG